MNYYPNLSLDYIGATGEHSITDYIDLTSNQLNDKINNISFTSVNSNIDNLRYETYHINSNNPLAIVATKTYSGTPHTYIINSNMQGEIRFNTYFSFSATDDPINNYAVKIDNFGKLYVYHKFNLLQPTFPAGWYDIEGEVLGLKNQGLVVDGTLAGLGTFQTVATGQINLLQSLVATLKLQADNLQYQIEMLGFLTGNEAFLIQGSQTFEQLVDRMNNLALSMSRSYTNTISAVGTVGVGLGTPLILSAVTDFFNRQYYYNLASNFSNAYLPSLTTEQRRILYSCNDIPYLSNTSNYNYYTCNLGLYQGFINSNVITNQFIPRLKSNKVMLGNITTPNSSYQLEMTGDINTNMLYINSTSLTSLLNQKQNNLTAVSPIYITTGNIGLNYDSTLLNNSGSLGVSIGAESKWAFTGANIYNKTMTNVGIGTDRNISSYKFNVVGESYFSSNVNIATSKLNFISSYTGATLTLATGTNEYYLQYTGNGTLVLTEPCACDLLVVGAGGNGGSNASSGGGGAGEVIYYPNFPLRNGTLNINVGTSSTNPANRISKIYHSSGDQISAKGGGDGGTSIFYTTSGGTVSALTAISGTSDAYILITAGTTLTLNASCSTDIFMIGGGGAGAYNTGGGGGSGAAIIAINQTIPSGSYNITVGAGGTINSTSGANGGNGGDTSIGSLYVAKGGGGGGYGSGSPSVTGNVGGSSGGAGAIQGNPAGGLTSPNPSAANVVGGTTGISPGTTSTYAVLGFKGGNSVAWSTANNYNQVNSGGGGGIGVAGGNGTNSSCGVGGDGVYQVTIADITYNLKNYFSPSTTFGVNDGSGNFYIGGGGGGGGYQTSALTVNGGKGGGGSGRDAPGGGLSASGATNTGSGGGGGEGNNNTPGGGGSGLVIIRFKNYLSIMAPTSGGSGGGGAKSQTGAVAGTKFDDYKSFALSGLSGNSTTGGNGGSGSSLYNSSYITSITGSSLSVGLGGLGVGATPATPTTKTNYGDGGDGNGGVGYQGIVIIRFKETSSYLQLKAAKDNANTGLILNANESPNVYQLRLYPWSDTYQLTGIATRGWSMRVHDGNNHLDLLNLFSSFGGRIGIKTKNPTATLDVNGDIACKTFSVVGNELYGITCQVVNQHDTGEANITISAGASGNYGAMSVVYLPSENLGYISCSKSLQIKTQSAGSYIHIDNTSGYVGIGNNLPQAKLHVSGTILASSVSVTTVNADSVAAGNISCTSLDLNNGSIIDCNRLNSVDVWTGPVKATSLDLDGGNITNGGFFYGMAQQARFLNMSVNEWHYDTQSRNRFYFTNDGTSSHTVFRTGSTTHYFQDRDGTDYCLLDRFGISTYFEVISGSGYDNLGVTDASATGVYVYRRMLVRLSTFTEVHRCFIFDELYTNYDDFINEYVGRVVVSTGKIKTALKKEGEPWQILEGKDGITIDDSHPVVELSRKKKDRAVVGVITIRNQNADLPNRLVINSLGETGIWVVNSGGCIETGDLITTSNELGYAEKQDCDFIKNYTIGKCLINCNFELDNPNYKCEVIDEARDLKRAFLPIFIYSG